MALRRQARRGQLFLTQRMAAFSCRTDRRVDLSNVGNGAIVFSNGSMGSGSFLSDVGAFGCLRSLRAHLALDGVSWVQGGLVEIAVGQETACYRIDAVICALPGRRSARELGWTSVSLMPLRLYRFELSTVSQHGMHDDREAPSERDPRFSHRRSSGDRRGRAAAEPACGA